MRIVSCALAAAMLAGCAASSAVPGGALMRAALHKHSSVTYTVLYSFGGYPADGVNPEANLIADHGLLYGTTVAGGSKCYPSGGCGTVFSVTTSGSESVVYSFAGGADGALPYAGLTRVNGVLYGTTLGGASSDGTVFSVTTSGAESVLHDFEGIPDGASPQASLIKAGQTLYGTTGLGGTSQDRGTVFAVTTSGDESIVHRFAGARAGYRDGKYPYASLLRVDGSLYGTTYEGGKYDRGTVFKITASGSESVVYSFKGGPKDGGYPRSGLVYLNGALYGTTSGGGIGRCEGCGNHEHFGTIFEITPSGHEKVIYLFKGYPKDGAVPDSPLLDVDGTFYGTTESGGANCAVTHGCGSIFSITAAGSETMLYSFLPKDGAAPVSGLMDVDGTLYGTTPTGGAYDEGTVYSLSP
jgi:uncharacterized repeat protein (TIGR03803 family)